MEKTLDIQWQSCQIILRDNLTPSVYTTWFKPLRAIDYTDGTLVVQVKSPFVVEYIEENYIDLLSKAIFRVFGTGTHLEYHVLVDSTSGSTSTVRSAGTEAENDRAVLASTPLVDHPAQPASTPFDSQLNPLYTFDTFIQGSTNRLARVAGVTIAQTPGTNAFNPLFIFGGSGVGKTHLAHAIGNQVLRLNPAARVLYVSAHTFKLQFMTATKENNLTNFLAYYQSLDVLIVDDIQYFSGVKATQDCFFHIFNHLQMLGRQLVLTCDRSPVELRDIEDRLLTRFKWGLSAEIEHPDFQLRHDILLDKMHRNGISLPDTIVNYIAHSVRDNVRDIEGILASLLAYSTLANNEIDMPLAEKVVANIVSVEPEQDLAIADIIRLVSDHYHLEPKVLAGSSRAREVAQARHMASYLCVECAHASYTEVGKVMGGRSHSTILYSVETLRHQLETDAVVRAQVRLLQAKIKR